MILLQKNVLNVQKDITVPEEKINICVQKEHIQEALNFLPVFHVLPVNIQTMKAQADVIHVLPVNIQHPVR